MREDHGLGPHTHTLVYCIHGGARSLGEEERRGEREVLSARPPLNLLGQRLSRGTRRTGRCVEILARSEPHVHGPVAYDTAGTLPFGDPLLTFLPICQQLLLCLSITVMGLGSSSSLTLFLHTLSLGPPLGRLQSPFRRAPDLYFRVPQTTELMLAELLHPQYLLDGTSGAGRAGRASPMWLAEEATGTRTSTQSSIRLQLPGDEVQQPAGRIMAELTFHRQGCAHGK